MMSVAGGALRITDAQVSDAGRYRCTADNPFGNVSAQVSVTVTGIGRSFHYKKLKIEFSKQYVQTFDCLHKISETTGYFSVLSTYLPF